MGWQTRRMGCKILVILFSINCVLCDSSLEQTEGERIDNNLERTSECTESGGRLTTTSDEEKCECQAGFELRDFRCEKKRTARFVEVKNNKEVTIELPSEIKQIRSKVRHIIRTAEDITYLVNILEKERERERDLEKKEQDKRAESSSSKGGGSGGKKTILIPMPMMAPPMPGLPSPMGGAPRVIMPAMGPAPGGMPGIPAMSGMPGVPPPGGPQVVSSQPNVFSFYWMPPKPVPRM